jgi:hypothetical protein
MGGICKKFESIRRYFMVQNLGREDTGEGNVDDPQTGGLGAVVWSCEKAQTYLDCEDVLNSPMGLGESWRIAGEFSKP